MTPPVPSEKGLELAYDAGQKRLAMQDTTLGNLRTRANTLLATAALFISFSAGVGLVNTDPTKGPVLDPVQAKLLVGILVVLGVCVISVLLPAKKWVYGPSAEKIKAKYDVNKTETEIRTDVIVEMIAGIKKNEGKLKWRAWAFRGAALLLVCEVGLLLSMLTFWKM